MQHRLILGILAGGALILMSSGCRRSAGGAGAAETVPGSSPVPDDRPSPIAASLPGYEPSRQSAESKPPLVTPEDQNSSAGAVEQQTSPRDSSTDWAIIAATYKSFAAAQRRASELKSTFAACACSVFPREGEGQKYYVVVDSGLTGEAADRKRAMALSAGLPTDTYVTKLSR